MDFNELKQVLGPVQNVEVILNVPDSDYHKQIEFATSSTIKEYLKDPRLAVQRRVLQTAPPKEWSDQAKRSMRIGRAIHTYVFEGEMAFKSRHPIFGQGRRGTKKWDDFVKENVAAAKSDNILTVEEAETVNKVSDNGSRAWQLFKQGLEGSQVAILAQIPEASFYVTYVNGLKVKVRADGLLLCHSLANPGQYFFHVIDGKTTARAVTDAIGLSFAIGDLGYAVSGAMYLNTIHECLQRTATWPKLIPNFDTSQWPDQIPLWGDFKLFWMSTSTHQCGFQTLMDISGQANESSWLGHGVVGYHLGLLRFGITMEEAQGRVASATAQEDKEVLNEVFAVEAAPLKKHFFELNDNQQAISNTPIPNGFGTTEKVLRDALEVFKPVPEAAPAAPEKPAGFSLNLAGKKPVKTPAKESKPETVKESTSAAEPAVNEGSAIPIPNTKNKVRRAKKADLLAWLDKEGLSEHANKKVKEIHEILINHWALA